MKIFHLFLLVIISESQAGIVEPSLYSKVGQGGIHDVILELPQVINQVTSSERFQHLSGDDRVNKLVSALQDLTSNSQAPFLKLAISLRVEYVSFWASNIILLKNVDETILNAFSKMRGDFHIREQHTVSVGIPHVQEIDVQEIKQTVQWGVEKIRAPEAWRTTQGEGAVVGSIDTGVNIGHDALSTNYGGAWLDPYYATGQPTDQNGHGTHTLGVIVGTENGIGVAPGAKWIACRGLNHQGSGTESGLTTCSQFLLNANPRPHAINNAWGGGSFSWFESQLAAWVAAGIVPIFGSGGSTSCGSITSPENNYTISVGRTTTTDELVAGSPRGPSSSGQIKPDLVAPAVNIVSAGLSNNNYVSMSGSASASHVSGVVALIVSAHPNSTVDEIVEILKISAHRPPISSPDDYCGPGPEPFPNNGYGFGRVDAASAVEN